MLTAPLVEEAGEDEPGDEEEGEAESEEETEGEAKYEAETVGGGKRGASPSAGGGGGGGGSSKPTGSGRDGGCPRAERRWLEEDSGAATAGAVKYLFERDRGENQWDRERGVGEDRSAGPRGEKLSTAIQRTAGRPNTFVSLPWVLGAACRGRETARGRRDEMRSQDV